MNDYVSSLSLSEKQHMSLNSCMTKEKSSYRHCFNLQIIRKNKLSKNKNSDDSNYPIYLILFLLWLSLFYQIFLFFTSLNNKEKLTDKHFYWSDWCINSAPMLGVLGTILSFALLVSKSNGNNLHEMFNKYFFDAAITTIIGGSIYVINLALAIKIIPKIDS
jgi:hypothetical protein